MGAQIAAPSVGLDIDAFDTLCDHLLVIDEDAPAEDAVVGTYRLLRESVAKGAGGFYSSSEFDLSPLASGRVDDTREIIDALKERFPEIAGPELRDICYATQNRQNAVRELAAHAELILVIGSANSSNSNRLRDLAEELGVAAYLIDDAKSLQPQWFDAIKTVGITAGASAPEQLVQDVVSAIGILRPTTVETLAGISENTRFKLPPEVTGERRLVG